MITKLAKEPKYLDDFLSKNMKIMSHIEQNI